MKSEFVEVTAGSFEVALEKARERARQLLHSMDDDYRNQAYSALVVFHSVGFAVTRYSSDDEEVTYRFAVSLGK